VLEKNSSTTRYFTTFSYSVILRLDFVIV
jgi:hypothetical protein